MDITWLALQSVNLLSPFLPKLRGFGEKVTEGVAQEIGGELWKRRNLCGSGSLRG